ncbi:MAG: hypothetical protein ACQESG_02850 [Nanobdellota archaeon]
MIIVVATALLMVLQSSMVKNVDTREVEANLFMHRLLYSKQGLSYYDSALDKVYPGIIDTGFDIGISYKEDHLAAKIELSNQTWERTEYFNRDLFEKIEPLSYGGSGPGSVTKVQQSLYVLTESRDPAKLVMTVVIQ